MNKRRSMLVLAIDLDNDIGKKAHIRGPIIGRKENLEAAQKLAISDPGETDVNTMFEAVKTYDELKKQNNVEIATLTGDERRGYRASANIASQLDKLIGKFAPDGVIVVSDGSYDEMVLPVIQSRIKIDEIRRVTIKQTKELETTYVQLLEKLKEPHYARIIFGIPGAALLLYFIWGMLGIRAFIGLLGLYLIIKGIGWEESFGAKVRHIKISFDRVSFAFYLASIALMIISLWIGASKVLYANKVIANNLVKLSAVFVEGVLLLLPIALLVWVAGSMLDAINEKNIFSLPHYLVKIFSIILFSIILAKAAEWILASTSFGDFFWVLIICSIGELIVIYFASYAKKYIASSQKLKGKKVFAKTGEYIGEVNKVNAKEGIIEIKTPAKRITEFRIDEITGQGEGKIVITF